MGGSDTVCRPKVGQGNASLRTLNQLQLVNKMLRVMQAGGR